jgi:zinc transport system substrate-binding protein
MIPAGGRSLAALLFALVLIAGCAGTEDAETPGVLEREDDGKLLVYVVNYPLQYFAERIGGELVRVEFPAPADEDPAFWAPGLEVIGEYQGADLIFVNGAGYAKWTERVSLPLSKVVNTSEDFADRYIVVDDAVTHSHGPGGGARPRRDRLHHLARSDPGCRASRSGVSRSESGAPR